MNKIKIKSNSDNKSSPNDSLEDFNRNSKNKKQFELL